MQVHVRKLWLLTKVQAVPCRGYGLTTSTFAGKYHVNFQRSLLELIRETRWLGRMGLDIPDIAQHLLPQETKFRDYYDKLTELLTVSSF